MLGIRIIKNAVYIDIKFLKPRSHATLYIYISTENYVELQSEFKLHT